MNKLTTQNESGGITVRDVAAELKKLADYEDAEEQGQLTYVTRCSDCVHGECVTTDGELLFCHLHSVKSEDVEPSEQVHVFMKWNDYCSDGRKKQW